MEAPHLRRIRPDDPGVGALAGDPIADVLLKSIGATTWLPLRSAIGLALLTSFGAAAASADPIEDRVQELLHWTAQETGYELPDMKVTIAFAAPTVINIVAHGVDYLGQTDIEAIAIGSGILLPDWFVLGRDDDVLVHELTHVLQHANGATFRCPEEQEREAYETAAAFTDLTGIGAKPSPWFMLFLRCNPNPWE